jgi:hypothetical protein
MPNNVLNKLSISGDPLLIKKIIGNKFSFENTVPLPIPLPTQLPIPLKPIDKNIESFDQREWCVQNWGTKWDAYDIEPIITNRDNTLILFTTAWNPPIVWIKKIGVMFPELIFELAWLDYYYPSSGIVRIHNNKCDFINNNHDDKDNNIIVADFIKEHFADMYEFYNEMYHSI